MKTAYEAFTDQLARRFTSLSDKIDATILAQMISGEDVLYCLRFELDAPAVGGLVKVFRSDSRLWHDFTRAIASHRQLTHWKTLFEDTHEVGNLQGKLKLMEAGLSSSSAEDRSRRAKQLNCIDGEIAYCRDLADRQGLASQVCRLAGFPLIDGLTMRALTYVLGEHGKLWQELQALVEKPLEVNDSGRPATEAKP